MRASHGLTTGLTSTSECMFRRVLKIRTILIESGGAHSETPIAIAMERRLLMNDGSCHSAERRLEIDGDFPN